MVSKNPATIHKPLDSYSHQIGVNGGAKWLVMSGQVGMDNNGNVPDDAMDQFEIALDNIFLNLEAAGMNKNNLVKLVFYFVGQHDAIQRRDIVRRKLGGHQPCMTLIYVAGLARDAYKVEIDAWAASD